MATLRFDKRLNEDMRWMVAEWGDQVYAADFFKAKRQALEEGLEALGIERKAADFKKLLSVKFWQGKLDVLELARALHAEVGEELSHDFNAFEKQVKKAVKKLKLKVSAAQLKQILDAVSWTDPDAEPVLHSSLKIRNSEFPYEPDSDLRDSENVSLNWLAGETDTRKVIQAYFDQEVKPHVDDAWIAWDKTVVGYEISFNKYFYVHQPLRDLGEVIQEIRDLEKETEGLLDQILDFAK